jgi:WhiB family redox-sensing transcriptional regulator
MRVPKIWFALPDFRDGLCATEPLPDLFFPDTAREERDWAHLYQAICESCHRRVECLDYALENNIEHGVWGGLTPAQREVIKPFRDKRILLIDAFEQLRAIGLSEEQSLDELDTSLNGIYKSRRHRDRQTTKHNTTQSKEDKPCTIN